MVLRLGFEETPDMVATRQALQQAIAAESDDFVAWANAYQELVWSPDELVPTIETRAGADITLALAFRDAGDIDGYLYRLVDVSRDLEGAMGDSTISHDEFLKLLRVNTIINEAIDEDW